MKPLALRDARRRPRLLFVVNEDWYFWTHRRQIAVAALEAGFDVYLATRVHEHEERIRGLGIEVIPMDFRRGARSFVADLRNLLQTVLLYRRLRPDVVHHVTVKNVLLGTLAARLTKVPGVVNAFAGLGFVFVDSGRRARWVRALLRRVLAAALRSPNTRTILQNAEDQSELVQAGVVPAEQAVLIRGAGVCRREFAPASEEGDPPVVVIAARMLRSKGIAQFVEAARQLQASGCRARFVVVGRIDQANPDHIPRQQLLDWHDSGVIQWWGQREDMPQVLAQAAIVCLPTYYGEGLPKILLEAAACGKPLVATDIRGCREICRHEINGFLVPPRDSHALAAALARLLEDPLLRARMGKASLDIARREFDVEDIARQTLEVYYSLLPHLAPKVSAHARAA